MQKVRVMLDTFKHNIKGIAAVEFALVFPILLLLYLGSIEISQGVSVNKRVSRVANTVADLVTQQDKVNKNDLNGILEIGNSIMFPYTKDKPEIKIVGIEVDSKYPLGGKVVWSRGLKDGAFSRAGYAPSDDIEVPMDLRVDGTFLVNAIVEIEYQPVAAWVITERTRPDGTKYVALDMEEKFWFRPRLSNTIPCADC